MARNLVNEPPNVLFPVEFADRLKSLEKLGVEVQALDAKAMGKLGMNALLGVGRGSARESRLVTLRWNGARSKRTKPIAIVGKGVCFNSGGISIKPSGGMEDMKGDMGGAACVAGLLHALAARKAKVNVVGVVGLVENMPDGDAMRPGDIVTSMSGQTIEIVNTDAEGRLVLADALWYTQETFSPRAIIDLATLTGAILVALGHEAAGLFANNDELAQRLAAAGEASGERVWRMPLGPAYDKLIELPIRRHEEYRRPQRRLDHRRPIPAAIRKGDAVGASRRRGNGDGLARLGHQSVLGFRLGRAPPRSSYGELLRRLNSH